MHSGSVLHAGGVVFPAVLAAGQAVGASGREIITAAVAGYEVGIRVGEFLGRSHYSVFHTTGTAGTLAAAAGVARILRLDASAAQHGLGSAGTQAAGLWEFLRDAADSKQLHTAKAAADGLLSAYAAREGLTGARAILEGKQRMAAGMSTRMPIQAGSRTGLAAAGQSQRHPSRCTRHAGIPNPAADALLAIVQEHQLTADDIAAVVAHVHQAALDVLGSVVSPRTVHQSKFSMGFVLALIAVRRRAGLADFTEAALADPQLRAFHDKVTMVLDPEIDRAYPRRWMGRVTVKAIFMIL